MVGKCSNLITRPTSSGSLAIVQCLMRDFPEDSGIFHIRIVNTTSQRYWDFLFIYFHDNWSQDRLTKLTTGNFLLAIVNDPWMITSGVEIIFPSFWRHCHGSHYYPCPADSAGCCDTRHVTRDITRVLAWPRATCARDTTTCPRPLVNTDGSPSEEKWEDTCSYSIWRINPSCDHYVGYIALLYLTFLTLELKHGKLVLFKSTI